MTLNKQLIGYHATDYKFDSFDDSKSGYVGHYFSLINNTTDEYIPTLLQNKKYTIKAKLNVTNPASVDMYNSIPAGNGNPRKIKRDALVELGYDHVIRGNEVIVFNGSDIEILQTVDNKSGALVEAIEPLPETSEYELYHGTNQEFDSFKHGIDNKGVTSKYGFWFTDSIEEAHQYGKKSSERMHKNQESHDAIIEKYLAEIENAERRRNWELSERLTNEMEEFEFNDDMSYYIYTVHISVDNPLTVDGSIIGSGQEDVIKSAIDKGYDSVIFKNISDSPYGMDGTTNQMVVFNNDVIKIISKDLVEVDGALTEAVSGKSTVIGYHGTDNKFQKFEFGRSKSYIMLSEIDVERNGFFFATNYEYASTFGKYVNAYNLDLGNNLSTASMDELSVILMPLVEQESDGRWWYSDGYTTVQLPYVTDPGKDIEWVNLSNTDGIFDWEIFDEPKVVSNIKSAGYDSAYVMEDDGEKTIVIFDPDNITPVNDNIHESIDLKGFIKSLMRDTNISLIESIINGYNVIFESVKYPNGFDINEYNKIPKIKQRMEYTDKHLRKIGEGSSRIVYNIDDDHVLKVAKNKAGVAQNKAEVNGDLQRKYSDIITSVVDQSPNHPYWIVSEIAEPITKDDFKRLTGYEFDDFTVHLYIDYLKHKHPNEDIGLVSPMLDDKYKNVPSDDIYKFYSYLYNMILEYGLSIPEFQQISTYGEIDDDLVVIDYGATDSIMKEHYKR